MSISPVQAQLRDGGLIPPQESATVTVTGCLMRGEQINGADDGKFVLANPQLGSVANTNERGCRAEADANALALDNPHKGNLNETMVGRWVEISGRLEKETSDHPDNLRELDVATAKLVPVVIPQAAAPAALPPVINAPAEAIAPPLEAPVGTSGQLPAELPRTAGGELLFGMLGLLAISAGFLVRSFRAAV